jgi:hypothetical protein
LKRNLVQRSVKGSKYPFSTEARGARIPEMDVVRDINMS